MTFPKTSLIDTYVFEHGGFTNNPSDGAEPVDHFDFCPNCESEVPVDDQDTCMYCFKNIQNDNV